MLDRKSQRLDLQKVRLAEQPIEINAQRMSGQFGIQANTQSPQRMGLSGLNVELLGQLPVDCLDDLTSCIDNPLSLARQLALLITSWQCLEMNSIATPQFGGLFSTDVSTFAVIDTRL